MFSSFLIRVWHPVAKIHKKVVLFPSDSFNFSHTRKIQIFILFLPSYKSEPRGQVFGWRYKL